jgi:VCBS repeat-containing protein
MAKSTTAIAKHKENAAKLPQAHDDGYDVSTGFLVGNEDSGLTISIADLFANDQGGASKSLYGLGATYLSTTTTDQGGTVTVQNGTLVYTPPASFDSLVGSNDPQSSVEGVGWATDSFTYTIQLGNGALSTATVTLRIEGVDDLAVIAGDDTGSVREEFDLTDTGQLSISDPDTGQVASFVAHDNTNPIAGGHGSLVIDADGNWTYTLNNTDAQVQDLTASGHLTDTITVHATDGATHDITIDVAGANEYSYVSGFFTRAQAEANADTAGGYLATVTSAEEQQLLFNLMTDGTQQNTGGWLGGSDAASEGTWIWTGGAEAGTVFWNGLSDGSAPAGQYENWADGEPNEFWLNLNPPVNLDEDYLHMWPSGEWNDIYATARFGYFVEIGV